MIEPIAEKITTIESKSPDIEIESTPVEVEQIVPDPIPVQMTPIVEEVVVTPPSIKRPDGSAKPSSELSEDQKRKMSYDEIQASMESERGKLRPHEYYSAPTRTL